MNLIDLLATPSYNSFNPATDSNEAIRDEGDAAWVTGDGTGGGGGGGATGTYGKHYGG